MFFYEEETIMANRRQAKKNAAAAVNKEAAKKEVKTTVAEETAEKVTAVEKVAEKAAEVKEAVKEKVAEVKETTKAAKAAKAETAEKYGDEQVKQWRRGFAVTPPELTKDDDRFPGKDPRYASLTEAELPLTESLALTIDRVTPYWEEVIKPRVASGDKVIIAAHGNSLRALVKYLDNMSEEEILELNIPTAVPLVYEFDENMKPIKRYYLGNAEEIAAKAAAVANQGKAK